jgi:D-arabinose 5-phosphate isomerase GutQ
MILTKDLILVSCINFAMTLYHLGTILFPFYVSMLHFENPSVTSKDLFAALFFLYIG